MFGIPTRMNSSQKIPDLLEEMAGKVNGVSKDFFSAVFKK